jgi:hypothetical protein
MSSGHRASSVRVPRSGDGAATAGMLGCHRREVKYLSTCATTTGPGDARAPCWPVGLDRWGVAASAGRARSDPGGGRGATVQGAAVGGGARPDPAVHPGTGAVPGPPRDAPGSVLRRRQPGDDGGVLSRP